MDPQKQLQALSDEYQGFQTGKWKDTTGDLSNPSNDRPELTTLVSARQKLESQQQENKSVQTVCHLRLL